MSRDKLIIFGVVLLGLLGVLVYQQAKKDESMGAPMAGTADFPSISAPDEVDKLEITNGDKGTVVVEKVADPAAAALGPDAGPAEKWVLTKPVHADANQQNIKDLLNNLKDLKVESRINLKLDDETRKEKQLDPGHALHLVASKGGLTKVDEVFGKSGGAGQLVIVSSKPDVVWATKGYSSYLYAKESKDFRDKSIFHFDDASVTDVEITNSHGTLSFKKDGDKWAAMLGKKPLERFDPQKVKDLISAYKTANADDFGDGKSLSETGLDKPDAQLTIHLKDDPKARVLLVGHIAAGTNRWAKRDDGETIYQIMNYPSEFVTSDASKYQLAADAGAPAAKTKGDAGKK